MVEEVVKKIAEIKDLDLEETRLQILENVKNLFNI
jgi:Tat protein secretion system quality control protein TatD with DNase activity